MSLQSLVTLVGNWVLVVIDLAGNREANDTHCRSSCWIYDEGSRWLQVRREGCDPYPNKQQGSQSSLVNGDIGKENGLASLVVCVCDG